MKQILQSARSGIVSVHEVPSPSLKPGHVFVRTAASLISAGTDLAGQYQGERFPTVPGYASVFDWTQAP